MKTVYGVYRYNRESKLWTLVGEYPTKKIAENSKKILSTIHEKVKIEEIKVY